MVKAYVLYLFSFINTHSASVTDLLVYRRKSDKVAFFFQKKHSSQKINDWSSIQQKKKEQLKA